MKEDIAKAQVMAQRLLDELIAVLPLARAVNRLDDWSSQYAKAYLFKLRVTR